jgi:AraC-like DNA-binding protein
MRQEPAVRSYSVTHPPGKVRLPAARGWDQLLYASAGVMSVYTPEGTWVVPRDRAVWVPSGADPTVVMHGRVPVRTLYLDAELRAVPGGCRVIDVSPLLRELILQVVRECPLDLATPRHERLLGVLVDQLVMLPDAPLRVPMPADPRARAVASALQDQPAGVSYDALARRAGASRRTIERLFAAETGMSLGRWHQRLRLIEALRLLARSHPVATVAATVGYSTPSAFTAAFRRELGAAPSRYFHHAT